MDGNHLCVECVHFYRTDIEEVRVEKKIKYRLNCSVIKKDGKFQPLIYGSIADFLKIKNSCSAFDPIIKM